MAKVVLVASGKGGAGKTTVCAFLGQALAAKNRRALLVELDSGLRALDVALGVTEGLVFDLGDDWTHLCTVERDRVDPLDTLGIVPELPMPYWGWGNLPDQYGRLWEEDDGESSAPRSPRNPLRDLPPILPWWGPPRR